MYMSRMWNVNLIETIGCKILKKIKFDVISPMHDAENSHYIYIHLYAYVENVQCNSYRNYWM